MARVVTLVGAGPGDPELLTLRAEELLAEAEIAIVDASLEDLARRFSPSAEILVVADGRSASEVVLGAAGTSAGGVVRLYRGDPWLHAAYEVERSALAAAGQPFETVPGVALEMGITALAGLAVHVRSLAVACTLGPAEALPPALDRARTLVASGDDPVAMAGAMAAVGDRDLPAALIPMAAPAKRWQGLLGGVMEQAAALRAPAVLVVGAAVGPPAEAP